MDNANIVKIWVRIALLLQEAIRLLKYPGKFMLVFIAFMTIYFFIMMPFSYFINDINQYKPIYYGLGVSIFFAISQFLPIKWNFYFIFSYLFWLATAALIFTIASQTYFEWTGSADDHMVVGVGIFVVTTAVTFRFFPRFFNWFAAIFTILALTAALPMIIAQHALLAALGVKAKAVEFLFSIARQLIYEPQNADKILATHWKAIGHRIQDLLGSERHPQEPIS